ncbi:hypothetical protein [Paenibacillus sacheonensis]|uniref:Uncharacterized protein n=1 Tax=Paenibacillus sacheonensis TaxID=742054 RepID=A0A7X5BZY4_9BACL|nr:hypothetical protein [Paenibacillus sacheonensis]MBM7567058.1 prefoldin subunit 5 [Paenibacillus sacheonensis]NBC71011.1 hypothetical protein [Paenibacillus sacheonensis]
MAISFTRSIIARLEKEIADLQALALEQTKKRDQAAAKIKQLQRDQKLSQSINDLNGKLARETKLKKSIDEINGLLAKSSKQLTEKKAQLAQHRQQAAE